MQEAEQVHAEAEPEPSATFDQEARATQPETDPARRARVAQAILGRVAAFGRFAFSRPTPRQPRHADTWRDKGPHESTGACARRVRQMAKRATTGA